jgi:ferritin-like protein
MSSESTHEPYDLLSDETKNLHRAIVSLVEELEAVDWYNQRASVCPDEELRAVLRHHRDEEIEHAMMNLEWIRRHDAVFDRHMRTYLFSSGLITEVEAEAKAASENQGASESHPAARGAGGSLGIGSLRTV